MSKSPDFFQRYVTAVFHRGKAEKLPMSYLVQEAERVLNPDEMQQFLAIIETMVQEGKILRDGDMLQLVESES